MEGGEGRRSAEGGRRWSGSATVVVRVDWVLGGADVGGLGRWWQWSGWREVGGGGLVCGGGGAAVVGSDGGSGGVVGAVTVGWLGAATVGWLGAAAAPIWWRARPGWVGKIWGRIALGSGGGGHGAV